MHAPLAAMARSRTPSPPRGIVALRARLPYHHRTEAAAVGSFVREWRRGLCAPPVVDDGLVYFPLAKEVPEWPGYVWARIQSPYLVEQGGYTYALDVTLWHGSNLASATELHLLNGSANGGRALVFHWPRAPRGRGRVIVSRLLGMSLLFREDVWGAQGYCRFDSRLHVHHVDGQHANCFLKNLRVEVGSVHVAEHNRARAGGGRRR